MTLIITASLITLLISLVLTHFMLKLPISVDIPGARSSHQTVTPRGGGVAIVLSWLVFLAIVHFFGAEVFSPPVLLLTLVSLIMAAIGFFDDVFQLSYKPRLLLQIVVALILILNGYYIDKIPLPGIEEITLGPVIGPLITLFWIVGFINAFNFMDGLNGLAGSCALVVSAIMLFFIPSANPWVYIFYGLIFSLLGYLRYNFHQGRIFMSDVGSQFLGCIFATTTLMIEPVTNGEVRFYVIPLLFLPFIYDAAYTFIYRLYKKENVFQPHLDHLIHKLHFMGFSHTQVTLLYVSFIVAQAGFVVYFLKRPSFAKLGLNLLLYILFSVWVHSRSSSSHKVKPHASTPN